MTVEYSCNIAAFRESYIEICKQIFPPVKHLFGFLSLFVQLLNPFIILKLPLQWFSRLLPLHNLHEVPTQRDNARMCSYD